MNVDHVMPGGRDGRSEPDELFDEFGARPYLVTGGRTRASSQHLSMETVVTNAPLALHHAGAMSFERGEILVLCQVPLSIAEIAARLHLPLTVAIVLVGDLVADDLLLASTAQERSPEDVDFIERLIAGVAAL